MFFGYCCAGSSLLLLAGFQPIQQTDWLFNLAKQWFNPFLLHFQLCFLFSTFTGKRSQADNGMGDVKQKWRCQLQLLISSMLKQIHRDVTILHSLFWLSFVFGMANFSLTCGRRACMWRPSGLSLWCFQLYHKRKSLWGVTKQVCLYSR